MRRLRLRFFSLFLFFLSSPSVCFSFCKSSVYSLLAPRAWTSKNIYIYIPNDLISFRWFVFYFAFWWRLYRSCLVIAWVVAQNTFRFHLVFPSFSEWTTTTTATTATKATTTATTTMKTVIKIYMPIWSWALSVVLLANAFHSKVLGMCLQMVGSRARTSHGVTFYPQIVIFFLLLLAAEKYLRNMHFACKQFQFEATWILCNWSKWIGHENASVRYVANKNECRRRKKWRQHLSFHLCRCGICVCVYVYSKLNMLSTSSLLGKQCSIRRWKAFDEHNANR